MDSFTYLIALFLMAFSVQFGLIWLTIGIALFLLASLRSVGGILLTLATAGVFLFLGENLQGDILYITVALVALAYFVGVKPGEEQAGGMSPDMLAALQGMGGGDEYGGTEGFGGGFQ